MVAASGLRGPQDDGLYFAICSSPPVRKQRTRRRNIRQYQCMSTRTKADAGMKSTSRKHFEGAPTNYHRIPFFASPAVPSEALRTSPANATIHAETSRDADWLKMARRGSDRSLLPTVMPSLRRQTELQGRVYGVGPDAQETRYLPS
jgi:hypothetical protein